MTRNEQKELLTGAVNLISKYDVKSILKFMIENSDKATRDKLEQHLMDNFTEEHHISFIEMFGEE